MSSTQIATRQIQNGAINDAQVNASAAIASSKLADGANFVKKDGTVAFTGSPNAGNNKIINVGTPSSSTDATTKGYVDTAISNLTSLYQYKGEARAATTGTLPANTYANGTAGTGATLTGNSNGALTAQDGVTLIVNDYLLVKNEATGANNGLYQLTQVGDGSHPYILTRATSMSTTTQYPGAMIIVQSEGSTLANTIWLCSNAEGLTVGTTAITFVQSATGGLQASNFVDNEVVSGTINGSNTTFTLANTPVSGTVKLYLNGVRQQSGAGNDFTISSGTITMLTAPISGDILIADYRK